MLDYLKKLKKEKPKKPEPINVNWRITSLPRYLKSLGKTFLFILVLLLFFFLFVYPKVSSLLSAMGQPLL